MSRANTSKHYFHPKVIRVSPARLSIFFFMVYATITIHNTAYYMTEGNILPSFVYMLQLIVSTASYSASLFTWSNR